MCLSVSGSCLNAPRITNVRTFHCGQYPGTLAALSPLNHNNNNNNNNKNKETIAAAHRAGPLAVFSDDFPTNSSSVHVDNRTDSVARLQRSSDTGAGTWAHGGEAGNTTAQFGLVRTVDGVRTRGGGSPACFTFFFLP
ncbi:hypothetical protein Q5P01_018377 [Channa striata]|uniref:Uncharacterized protein n=1 Tax=Channa striata TaxID=64152 RepID=A0AA88M4I9_CHASR|nr:hypothetical protein Q5P01_018377 [Channa striata]